MGHGVSETCRTQGEGSEHVAQQVRFRWVKEESTLCAREEVFLWTAFWFSLTLTLWFHRIKAIIYQSA